MGDQLGKDYNVYAKGVKGFLEFAYSTVDIDLRIKCLGRKCKNLRSHKMDLVGEHLFVNGIEWGYTDSVLHGEPYTTIESLHDAQTEDGGHDYDEDMEQMLGEIGARMFMNKGNADTSTANDVGHNTFERLWNDLRRELYPGCKI